MGIRKDFLVHQRRTVDSFRFVRVDISSINANIENMRNMLVSIEPRISALENQISNLGKTIDKCTTEINIQQNNNYNIQSKIGQVSESMSDMIDSINTFKSNINKIISNGQLISKNLLNNTNSIKKLFLISKTQSLKNKQLDSALKKSQQEIKKVRNLLNNKLRTIKRKDLELEAKIKSHRKSVIALNKKIQVKKAVGKKVIRKSTGKIIKKKIVTKKSLPEKKPSKISVTKKKAYDKTIITVKTPKRTIVEAVTPTKKKLIDVVRGKNPLV